MLTFLRLAGAAMRLTRLVVVDDLGDRLVQQPLERAIPDEDHPARALVSCPWCIGYWITLALLVIETTPLGRTTLWRVLTASLAGHYLITHVAVRLGDYDDND